MKSKYVILLVLLLGNSIITGTIMNRVESVTNEEIYTYDVLESKWRQQYDNFSSVGEGYNFNDILIPVGTQFTVTADFEHDYTYIIKVNDLSHDSVCATHLFMPQLMAFTDFPRQITFASFFINNWNQTRYDLGPPIREFFYLDTYASNYFHSIASTDYIQTHYYSLWDFTQFNITFVNNTDIAKFTCIINGQYRNDTMNTNFSGTYEFTFVYNQTSGIMQGYRIDLNYKGKITGIDVTFIYYQEVEIEDYNLPNRVNKSGLPGFALLTLTIVLSILTLKRNKKLR